MNIDVEFCLKAAAVVAAITALTLTWRTHAERATFEMIHHLYGLWYNLQDEVCRDWFLAHLLSIGFEDYEHVKNTISLQVAENSQNHPEYRVKERLVAIHVFMIYEQVYYQWNHSSRILHRRRRRFLEEVLAYFTNRLLRNPRLLHFFRDKRSSANLHLEKCSREYFGQILAAAAENSENLPIDSSGPFPEGESSH